MSRPICLISPIGLIGLIRPISPFSLIGLIGQSIHCLSFGSLINSSGSTKAREGTTHQRQYNYRDTKALQKPMFS